MTTTKKNSEIVNPHNNIQVFDSVLISLSLTLLQYLMSYHLYPFLLLPWSFSLPPCLCLSLCGLSDDKRQLLLFNTTAHLVCVSGPYCITPERQQRVLWAHKLTVILWRTFSFHLLCHTHICAISALLRTEIINKVDGLHPGLDVSAHSQVILEHHFAIVTTVLHFKPPPNTKK